MKKQTLICVFLVIATLLMSAFSPVMAPKIPSAANAPSVIPTATAIAQKNPAQVLDTPMTDGKEKSGESLISLKNALEVFKSLPNKEDGKNLPAPSGETPKSDALDMVTTDPAEIYQQFFTLLDESFLHGNFTSFHEQLFNFSNGIPNLFTFWDEFDLTPIRESMESFIQTGLVPFFNLETIRANLVSSMGIGVPSPFKIPGENGRADLEGYLEMIDANTLSISPLAYAVFSENQLCLSNMEDKTEMICIAQEVANVEPGKNSFTITKNENGASTTISTLDFVSDGQTFSVIVDKKEYLSLGVNPEESALFLRGVLPNEDTGEIPFGLKLTFWEMGKSILLDVEAAGESKQFAFYIDPEEKYASLSLDGEMIGGIGPNSEEDAEGFWLVVAEQELTFYFDASSSVYCQIGDLAAVNIQFNQDSIVVDDYSSEAVQSGIFGIYLDRQANRISMQVSGMEIGSIKLDPNAKTIEVHSPNQAEPIIINEEVFKQYLESAQEDAGL